MSEISSPVAPPLTPRTAAEHELDLQIFAVLADTYVLPREVCAISQFVMTGILCSLSWDARKDLCALLPYLTHNASEERLAAQGAILAILKREELGGSRPTPETAAEGLQSGL